MPDVKVKELPKINLNSFVGGESIDLKNGISGSFYSSLGMDFREKASQASVQPGFHNITATLHDLITAMDQDLNGIRYGVGDQGYVYEIDNSNVVTTLGQLDSAGAAGCVYNAQNDNVYMSSQQSVSLYGQATNPLDVPTLSPGHFGASASVAPAVIYTFNSTTSSYDGGTVAGVTTQRNNLNTLTVQGVTPANYAAQVTNTLVGTYGPPQLSGGVPLETAGNFCAFIPDIEPFSAVAIYITTVGTGNLTLTMHDSSNNNLGSVTVPHASLTTGWNLLSFAAPGIRAFVNAIASNNVSTGYHFHLTSSVANDAMRVATIANGDLTGANFVLFANRLIATQNGWHPMTLFNQYLVVGNSNYVSTYNFGNDSNPNNAQWVRHQLFLDVGYEVTGLSNSGQYLIITAARRSNNGSRQYQGGYIYLWDGGNQSFNLKVPIPMGAPYAPFCFNNVVYFFCNGSFFAYAPGSTTVNKVRYIGFQNTNYLNAVDTTVVNPNMMAARYNVLQMGYPSSTTNPKLNMGVYSWGAVELIYPNSFGFTGVAANGLQNSSGGSGSTAWTGYKIGMIENFVDTMYMSSEYVDHNGTTQYKLDVMDNTSSVSPNFGITCLMWDGGARYKQKKGLRIKVSCVALPTGVTITPWYSIDRGAQIVADANGNSFVAGVGATEAFINVPAGTRSHELQWGFNGTAANGTMVSPVITGITAEIDGLGEEPDLRPDG
jgi:hypothetical protein